MVFMDTMSPLTISPLMDSGRSIIRTLVKCSVALLAIKSLSVLMMISTRSESCSACAIWWNKGSPAKGRIFLPDTRSECPFIGNRATILLFEFGIEYLFSLFLCYSVYNDELYRATGIFYKNACKRRWISCSPFLVRTIIETPWSVFIWLALHQTNISHKGAKLFLKPLPFKINDIPFITAEFNPYQEYVMISTR